MITHPSTNRKCALTPISGHFMQFCNNCMVQRGMTTNLSPSLVPPEHICPAVHKLISITRREFFLNLHFQRCPHKIFLSFSNDIPLCIFHFSYLPIIISLLFSNSPSHISTTSTTPTFVTPNQNNKICYLFNFRNIECR